MNLQETLSIQFGVGKVPADSKAANYMGPDKGPFSCGRCRYFGGNNQPCAKVLDLVQTNGCCNLFQKGK